MFSNVLRRFFLGSVVFLFFFGVGSRPLFLMFILVFFCCFEFLFESMFCCDLTEGVTKRRASKGRTLFLDGF